MVLLLTWVSSISIETYGSRDLGTTFACRIERLVGFKSLASISVNLIVPVNSDIVHTQIRTEEIKTNQIENFIYTDYNYKRTREFLEKIREKKKEKEEKEKILFVWKFEKRIIELNRDEVKNLEKKQNILKKNWKRMKKSYLYLLILLST